MDNSDAMLSDEELADYEVLTYEKLICHEEIMDEEWTDEELTNTEELIDEEVTDDEESSDEESSDEELTEEQLYRGSQELRNVEGLIDGERFLPTPILDTAPIPSTAQYAVYPQSYIDELKELFNRPKSPYLFSINDIIKREHGLVKNIKFSARQRVENIRFPGLKLLYNFEYLHFNRKGNLLYGLSEKPNEIILQGWPNLTMNLKITLTGVLIGAVQFLKYSDYTDMAVITDKELLLIKLLPTGVAKRMHSYDNFNKVLHIIVNPQTENEIITVGSNEEIHLIDTRDYRCHNINKNSKDKMSMWYVAHHPSQPEISVCGDSNYTDVYDKRNMQRAVHKLGPGNVSFLDFTALTCNYNYSGTEILINYTHRIADVYANQASDTPGKYLHRFRGHDWLSSSFMGSHSQYVVTTHGGYNSLKYNNMYIWEKKTEALLNFDFLCDRIDRIAVHPKHCIVAYRSRCAGTFIIPVMWDNDRYESLTFERILKRYNNLIIQ